MIVSVDYMCQAFTINILIDYAFLFSAIDEPGIKRNMFLVDARYPHVDSVSSSCKFCGQCNKCQAQLFMVVAEFRGDFMTEFEFRKELLITTLNACYKPVYMLLEFANNRFQQLLFAFEIPVEGGFRYIELVHDL